MGDVVVEPGAVEVDDGHGRSVGQADREHAVGVEVGDPEADVQRRPAGFVPFDVAVEEIDRFRLRDISLIEVLRQPRYGQQHSEDQKRGLAPADMAANAQFDVPRRLSSRTPPILNK